MVITKSGAGMGSGQALCQRVIVRCCFCHSIINSAMVSPKV